MDDVRQLVGGGPQLWDTRYKGMVKEPFWRGIIDSAF